MSVIKKQEYIFSGTQNQFRGLIDQWVYENPREWPTLYGPYEYGVSINWFVSNGSLAFGALDHKRSQPSSAGWSDLEINIYYGMDLAEIEEQGEAFRQRGKDFLKILGVAKISAIELPEGKTRIIFYAGGMPSLFDMWVNIFVKEIKRFSDFSVVTLEVGEISFVEKHEKGKRVVGKSNIEEDISASEKQDRESPGEFPNWWPKNESTKIRWRTDYKKISPLLDKSMTYIAIAKRLGMSRHHISHVVRWMKRSPEGHQ